MAYLTLFDTNATIDISSKIMEKCVKKKRLYANSISFWEIMSHLAEDFIEIKQRLMKFKYLSIIEDSFASLQDSMGIVSEELSKRGSDKYIVAKLLENLHKSENIEQFYSSNILDDNGNSRIVRNVADRLNKYLTIEENRYKGFIKIVIADLKADPNIADNADNFFNYVQVFQKTLIDKLLIMGARKCAIHERAVNRSLLYNAFVIERALEYYHKGSNEVPGNDYEDSVITLGISLDKEWLFVTKDRAFRISFNKVIEMIQTKYGRGFGIKAVSTDEFKIANSLPT